MQGTVVNAIAIVVGALAGVFMLRRISDRFEQIIRKALGLSIFFIGLNGALVNQRPLLLIMSMVIGSVIGEWLNLDDLMNRVGLWGEKKLGLTKSESGGGKSIARAFVAASVLFCSGSMAIVGAIQGGLAGEHQTLYAKAILDGVISIVFGASLGLGTMFAAIPVLLYQGGIALAAMGLKEFLNDEMVREMSAVGSLIIAAIGLNFLEIKEIKVANLIPAVFIPLIYLLAASF